jgi:hypothetical protein
MPGARGKPDQEQFAAGMVSSASEDFSLAVGGPLYQLYLRARLAGPALKLLRRRIIACLMICWFPLLILSLAEGHAISGVHVPFLLDIETYTRFFVALPLLLVAEVVVHRRISPLILQFKEREIVSEADWGRFQAIVASTMRQRNSITAEVILLVLSVTISNSVWREHLVLKSQTWYALPSGEEMQLTVAGLWYVGVSLTVLRFMLYRWYFRILLWYQFLWRVRGLPLHLNLFHPDRAAGLGFLNVSLFAFAPILVAHTAFLAGFIGERIVYDNARLSTFKMDVVGVVVLLMLVVIIPLCFFVSHLKRARRTAIKEYGLLASLYVNDFRRKWINDNAERDASLLGTPDIQSLADLSNAYTVISEMRLLPFGKRTRIELILLLLAPLLPLSLAEVPLEQIIDRTLKLAL